MITKKEMIYHQIINECHPIPTDLVRKAHTIIQVNSPQFYLAPASGGKNAVLGPGDLLYACWDG